MRETKKSSPSSGKLPPIPPGKKKSLHRSNYININVLSEKSSDNAIPSLMGGFNLLGCLVEAGASQGVSQIAQAVSLPRTTVYRMLQAFVRLGYVEQHDKTRRYSLSPKIFGLMHYLTSHFSPSRKAADQLREISKDFNCTVHLSMLAGDSSYVVCAAGPLGDTQVLGKRSPAHATPSGRILISQLPIEAWDRFIPHDKDFTDALRKSLIDELESTAKTGIAWGPSESAGYSSIAGLIHEPGRSSRLAIALLYPNEEWLSLDRKQLTLKLEKISENISDHLIPLLQKER